MKKLSFYMLMSAALAFTACSGHSSHNHDDHAAHSHDGHDHDHDGHDHEHEGHDHEHEGHDHDHESGGGEHKNSDEIEFDAAKAKAAGVTVEVVKASSFNEILPVSGSIMPSASDESTVSAPVSGIVSLGKTLAEGMQVGSGTVLMSISSKGLQEGDAAQKARIEYETARAQYERDAKLAKDKIVSEKHLADSKAAYENAKLAYEALGNGKSDGKTVSSPRGGYVKQCLVKSGDYVSVGQPLVSITSNRSLYLRAEVPERYYNKVSGVSSARFRTATSTRVYDLKTIGGRVVSIGKVAQEGDSYIPIIFEMNAAGDMMAGSFADIWLVGKQRENVITVPRQAITEEQGLYFVYVQLDEDCYKKTNVSLGATDGLRTEIVSGLVAGNKVVVNGVAHIRLAGASGAIPGHTHEH